MRFYLKSLGCRLNEAEVQSWSQQFMDLGHELTTSIDNADLVVLNSCAVTGEAARKSRQNLRRLHRENPTAKIVVTGCYATLEEASAAAIDGVDLVIPNSKKEQLVDIINEQFHFEQQFIQTMPAFATQPGESALYRRNRERAFIKIQDGCRYRCSYCIVTVARGKERSRTIGEIINEINRYSAQGIHEIVLTGVHVGGYGSDLKLSLFQLIEAILSDTDMPRIRFASVEPWDLAEEFFSLFENQRLMPHMHLPIQSGSDSVLKRMSRRSNQQSFTALIETARTTVANFNATTDIIVGFPGETEDEWQQTLDFIQQIGFGHIHIFSYSLRQGTRAATFKEQIPAEIKKQRSKELGKIALTLKQHELSKMQGQTVAVLWESGVEKVTDNCFQIAGYTPNYHRVKAVFPADISGQVLPVTLGGVSADGLHLQGFVDPSNITHLETLISVKQV